ncbi:MAG TPA: RNA polymerase sigma factor [Thermoanaerobaculia bacterium]|nr:RNA polymerase sigma factor [Thermoanaerobaculia bacterium]
MTRRDEKFDAVYRKYLPRIYRYFRQCRVSDDESHDLAQDTFSRFYASMDRHRGEAEWAYLEQIALNVLRNWLRAQKTAKRSAKLVELDDPEFTQEPEAPALPDYAERQHQDEQRRSLHEAIADLTEAQRQVLQLWLEDMQYNEIAVALHISVDAVKSRLRDAKRILSARLGDKFREETE